MGRIPKIIHYGWFGRGKKSKLIENCIASWKKYLPDYEIREWNEDNFPFADFPFAREAYEAHKYAFVSDYLRVYVLYHYGGIYFDTDVEALRNFEDKLERAEFVVAFERLDALMTGFMAAVPGHEIMRRFLAYYDSVGFYDEKGEMRLTPNTNLLGKLAAEFGMIPNGKYQELAEGIRIYPNEVFGGYDVYNMLYTVTENTVAVHHYTASWRSPFEKMSLAFKKLFLKLFGIETYRVMRKLKHKIKGDREWQEEKPGEKDNDNG